MILKRISKDLVQENAALQVAQRAFNIRFQLGTARFVQQTIMLVVVLHLDLYLQTESCHPPRQT